jgi:hypothetical protein
MEVNMMALVKGVFVACLLLGFAEAKACAGSQKTDDVKWARRVAEDFFASVLSTDDHGDIETHIAGLLHPELVKALQTARSANRYNHLPFSHHLARDYSEAKIIATDSAPHANEVIVSGVLRGRSTHPDADFVLRIVRQTDRCNWTIRYVRITPRGGLSPGTPMVTQRPAPGSQ